MKWYEIFRISNMLPVKDQSDCVFPEVSLLCSPTKTKFKDENNDKHVQLEISYSKNSLDIFTSIYNMTLIAWFLFLFIWLSNLTRAHDSQIIKSAITCEPSIAFEAEISNFTIRITIFSKIGFDFKRFRFRLPFQTFFKFPILPLIFTFPHTSGVR